MSQPLRIGTRGSPLALAQAHMVVDALRAKAGVESEIVPITTSGDLIQDRALAEVGGKALWTKELDRALLDGRTDLSVHSMKDVETLRPEALVIAAMLERADVQDRLIGADSLDALPQGARVGTSSPRRTAQLLSRRPDLNCAIIRGNVQTRLARIAAGEFDATMLAAAGLDRLGLELGTPLPFLAAPGQGAIGVETLAANEEVIAVLTAINHEETRLCVTAEREFLAALGGDCHSAVAALAVCIDGMLSITAEFYLPDGSDSNSGTVGRFTPDSGAPAAMAEILLKRASPALRAMFAR